MDREYVYYGVIALCVVCIGLILWRSLGTGNTDGPSESPDSLVQTIDSAATEEEQFQAARDLARYGRQARTQLRSAVANSEGKPPTVQKQLFLGVTKAGDWQSLPELFRAMEHPDQQVRGSAGSAAQAIMGMDFQFRANDPPQKRAAILSAMREEYTIIKSRLQELDEQTDAQLQ